MYKRVLRLEVPYGKFRDFRKALQTVDAMWRSKGLTPARAYVLEFGPSNVVSVEWDLADFAHYERDGQMFFQDEELRAAWAAVIPYVIQGTMRDELWRPLEF